MKISEEDMVDLKAEVNRMLIVLRWLDDRIAVEQDAECRQKLIDARDYVRDSIDAHRTDIGFMSK